MTELLDDQPSRPSRRSWLVVGVLVLALLAVGVEDRRAHAAEASRVDRCAAVALGARSVADQRVGSMLNYVRPAFDGSYSTRVRAGLARLVSGAARRAVPDVVAAEDTCARVDVRRWHGDLDDRRSACLAALDAELEWLAEVRRDGGTAFRATAGPATGCTAG